MPPLVVAVSAIVPLLPGLSIYRGLSLLATGGNGLLSLMAAAAIAVALASGVILGEYVAQPLRREARKMEKRLAGPRLVGPLRTRERRPAWSLAQTSCVANSSQGCAAARRSRSS